MVTNSKKTQVAKKSTRQSNKKTSFEKRNRIISDGILLALASASAYFFTFSYEKSYADYFGIPTDLITVSFNSALLFFTIILGFFGVLFLILEISTPIFKQLNLILLQSILPIFSALLFVLIQMYFFGFNDWIRWASLLVFVLTLGALTFIIPLFTQKDKATFLEKLKAQQEYEQKSVSFLGVVFRLFGLTPSVLLLLFVFGYFLADTAGVATAKRRTDFLVVHSNPEIVILRIYGDLAVGAPFDRKTRELDDKFTFISIKQNPQTIFELETVGPFTRKDKQKSIMTNLSLTPSAIAPSALPSITPTP